MVYGVNVSAVQLQRLDHPIPSTSFWYNNTVAAPVLCPFTVFTVHCQQCFYIIGFRARARHERSFISSWRKARRGGTLEGTDPSFALEVFAIEVEVATILLEADDVVPSLVQSGHVGRRAHR